MSTLRSEYRLEYERRLHRVLAHIDEHIDEPVSLADLAAVACFSAHHFHRIFSLHFGETLGNYLTRRRVEKAAAYLASQPSLEVLNVALAVGFGSAEAFARAFKKHFSCTPSEWKKRSVERLRQKSKISQTNRRLDQAKRSKNGYAMPMTSQKRSPLHVTVTKRPAVRVAYLRYQGAFGSPLGLF